MLQYDLKEVEGGSWKRTSTGLFADHGGWGPEPDFVDLEKQRKPTSSFVE